MKTTTVVPGSTLDTCAEELFLAAQKYWDEYEKTMKIGDAVVWVEQANRGLLLFTRGEYAQRLKEFVADLPSCR